MEYIYGVGKLQICKHMLNGVSMALQTAKYKELKSAWIVAKVLILTKTPKNVTAEVIKETVEPILNNDLLAEIVIADIIYNATKYTIDNKIKINVELLNEINFEYDPQKERIHPRAAKNISCNAVKLASAICAQSAQIDSKYTIYCFENERIFDGKFIW